MSQKGKGGTIKAPQIDADDSSDVEMDETTEGTDETGDDTSDAKNGDKKKLRMKREPLMVEGKDTDGKAIMVQATMTVVIPLFKLSWDFNPLGIDRIVVLDESKLDPSIMAHSAHHGIGQKGTDAMALGKGATIRQKADALFKELARIIDEKTWRAKRDPEAQKKALARATEDGKRAGLTAAAEALVANKVAKDLKAAYAMLGIVID